MGPWRRLFGLSARDEGRDPFLYVTVGCFIAGTSRLYVSLGRVLVCIVGPQGAQLYSTTQRKHSLAKVHNSAHLMAGIVKILVQMCADSILKERLLEQGNIHLPPKNAN